MVFATCAPNSSGSTSLAGRARAKLSSVHSRFSSSISSGFGCYFITFHLSGVGLAQTDNVWFTGARREYNGVQPFAHVTQHKKSSLSVCFAGVFLNLGSYPIKLLNKRK